MTDLTDESESARLGRLLLGRRLRSLREEVGQSAAETCKRANLSYSYLSDVERGRRLPALDKLAALARALGTSTPNLLTGLYPWDTDEAPINVEPPEDGRRRARR